MSLFDDIESLESTVADILRGTENYGSISNFQDAYVDAIIQSFGDFSNEELGDVDIENVVKQALNESADFIDTGLATQIEGDINTVVGETMSFYNEQGIAMPNLVEAIERNEAVQRMNEEFTENMGSMRDELLDQTIDSVQTHIAKGNISRQGMIDDILEAADGNLHHARTNARMAVSAMNRIARDEVRQSAGLDHGFYYGDRRDSTRAFCIKCIGRVFSMKQINRMSNGQGLSVLHYCGGWNCIHSWLWMEPEWDSELQERFDAERSIVDLEDSGLDLKVPADN